MYAPVRLLRFYAHGPVMVRRVEPQHLLRVYSVPHPTRRSASQRKEAVFPRARTLLVRRVELQLLQHHRQVLRWHPRRKQSKLPSALLKVVHERLLRRAAAPAVTLRKACSMQHAHPHVRHVQCARRGQQRDFCITVESWVESRACARLLRHTHVCILCRTGPYCQHFYLFIYLQKKGYIYASIRAHTFLGVNLYRV